jgi:hypothetical protein
MDDGVFMVGPKEGYINCICVQTKGCLRIGWKVVKSKKKSEENWR